MRVRYCNTALYEALIEKVQYERGAKVQFFKLYEVQSSIRLG